MRKSILVAMDLNKGIGFKNRLPWHLPAELKRFKALTMGHHLILGRKTYQSIGKPLPGRTTIIVTRNPDFHAEGCLITNSVVAAFELAESRGENEVFVCGGTAIYQEAIKEVDRLYLTRVHANFPVDTFFPDFDVSLWMEIVAEFHPADDQNSYPFTFYIFERRQ